MNRCGVTLFFFLSLQLNAQMFAEVHEQLQIFETSNNTDLASGLSCADLNGDGVEELLFPTTQGQQPHIYTWEDDHYSLVAIDAFTFELGSATSLYAADYDNDGDKDLLVCNNGSPNSLYRNDGDFSFVNTSSSANLNFEFFASYGACFTDVDRDGWLDIYVINRSEANSPMPNRLYHNLGNGTFDEVGQIWGCSDTGGASMAVSALDINNDQWPDLYVANDRFTGNRAFLNNGDGTFTDISASTGCDLEYNYMSVSPHDIDGNGYDDMYISNTQQGNALLINGAEEGFEDQCTNYSIDVNELCWGSHFFDSDNDGDKDLYVATASPNPVNDAFFEFEMGGFEADTTSFATISTNQGMGIVSLDYNDDGDIDLVISNGANQEAWFYDNPGNSNNYIKIELEGMVSNRDGIGSLIELWSGNHVQRLFTRCGGDYAAQSSSFHHFGLGNTVVDSLVIHWPSGIEQTIIAPIVNSTLLIVEEEEVDFGPLSELTTSVYEWTLDPDFDVTKEHLHIYNTEGCLIAKSSFSQLNSMLRLQPQGMYIVRWEHRSSLLFSGN